MLNRFKHNLFILALPFVLLACGGGGGETSSSSANAITVSGSNSSGATVSITGSSAGTGTSNTNSVTFSFNVQTGDSVSLAASKAGNTCTITNFTNPTVISASITGVTISCVPNTYTVSGIVTGNAGTVTLTNNGGDTKTVISGGGSFTFTAQNYGTTYLVATTSPTGQSCYVTNGTGTVSAAVNNVSVSCNASTYTISGTNNTGAALIAAGSSAASSNTITGTTSFSLNARYGDTITITATKVGNTCSVNGLPSTVTSDVSTGVTVSCTPITYTISGLITGYSTTGTKLALKLRDTTTNTDLETIPNISSGAVSFTFTNKVTYGHDWVVSVTTQPTGQTCLVTGTGSGTNIQSDQSSVVVSCSDTTYTVEGNIATYTTSGPNLLGLKLTDVTTGNTVQSLPNISSTTNFFIFSPGVIEGHSWSVTFTSQPSGQYCSITGTNSGINIIQNVTNLAISCVAATTNCSSASNALSHTSDEFWATYSAPTGTSSNSTPEITSEQTNRFAACLGGP